MNATTYKEGDVILFERGEYSDRRSIAMVRVIKTFDIAEYARRWKELRVATKKDDEYCDEVGTFLAWILTQGVIEEIDYNLCHLGDYGELLINWGQV